MRYAFALIMIAIIALAACDTEENGPELIPDIDDGTDEPDAPLPPLDGTEHDMWDDIDDDFFSDETYDDDIGIDEDWDPDVMMGDPDVLIAMDGGMYWFEVDGVRNPDITVQRGDFVRIELTSVSGRHDVVIDELGARSDIIGAGESTYVEFIADQVGEFEYYCSVGSHRERGMSGTFIVE